IEWRQENVTEDGRNHTPLGSTALTGKEPPFAVAAGLEHRLDKAKHSAVRHSLGYEGEKLLVIDRPEKISEICIHHPLPPSCISFQILRSASFVDRPRRYPKLASSNIGSKKRLQPFRRRWWTPPHIDRG